MPSPDTSKPHFPLAGGSSDGFTNDDESTATCFCGAVQLAFPLSKPGLVDSFICNCTDCHKITASMFASNFVVQTSALRHLRGEADLTQYAQKKTPITGSTMTNFFCKTCGSLMYRRGDYFPGMSILRIGTVDDFSLHETKLKPRIEIFTKDRVDWLHGAKGIEQAEGFGYWRDDDDRGKL